MNTIKEAWNDYKTHFLSDKLSKNNLLNNKHFFYMGAWRSYTLFRIIYEDKKQQELEDWLYNIDNEFSEYSKNIKQQKKFLMTLQEPACRDCGQPIYPWLWRVSDLKNHLIIVFGTLIISGTIALYLGYTF